MARILVTGASGFVGRQVCSLLTAEGHEVIGSGRGPTPVSFGGTRWLEADLLAANGPASLVERTRTEILVHAAWHAAPGYAYAPQNSAWLRATIALGDAFARVGGRRIVGVGSCAEYRWGDPVLRPSVTPLEPSTPYGCCKKAAHTELEALAARAAIELAWARLFFLYGPGEHPDRLVASLARRLVGGETAPLSAGAQRRDYLDVRDAAAAIAALATATATGAFDVCSGEASPVGEIAQIIGKLTGREDLLAIGARDASTEVPVVAGDPTAIREATGWTPRISMLHGLADAVRLAIGSELRAA